ncbi:zinc finger protein 687a [Leuresthes tenuis]|uniref:zinc finger protein 687a n=1 Tax=Leuresthes tenuis TaxID=355514 RepID=UPI003B5096B9
MGDMKTPDFDDLLAAFDIPDIDAKEAIQSNPEEQRDEVGTNAHESKGGTSSCFPGPAAPQNELPVISVIVKNTVRSESFEEEENSARNTTDNPLSSDLASQAPVKLDDPTPQLGPKLTANAAKAAMEPDIANGFEEAIPSSQEQSNTESWSHPSPFRSTLNDNEGDKGAEPGSIQHPSTTDVINSLRPLLYPQSSTTTGTISSSPPAPPSISPHISPHSPQSDKANPLSSPLPQNGSVKSEIKHVLDTDDDSEPDLGSPLVIQEGPESPTSFSPKIKHKPKLHSDLLGSTENTFAPPNLCFTSTHHEPQRDEDGQPTNPSCPVSTQLQNPLGSLPSTSTSSAVVQEEKYPEHVIDERDSPESPPPSETGLVFANRSSSSDLSSTPGPALDHMEFHHQKEFMEVEHSHKDKPGDTTDLSEKVDGDGDKSNEENSDARCEDTVLSNAAETVSSPLRPLKVKIKMPTGSITRTVTGGTYKRTGKAATKDGDNPKPSPELHNTRSKKELLPQSELPAGATLEGASTVKEKTSVETKPKVSPTAVSITKSAALPSVSSSRLSPGAVNLRSLGQKTLHSGMSLPTPLPFFPPQTSSRPASIVNSTGAIISKSQTNLVDAFNKILNNKNLLPCYKPDLSSPIPAEWGISLPSQGYRCLECGDAFALEQSLAQHYDRRSLRIEVTCNHCAKRLAFFNKCSLLLHAREHKEKGLIMQCSHLVMKPVPVEQMISQQEPAAAGQALKSAAQAHHAGPVKKEAEAVQYMGNKCPECQVQFGSKEEVSDHFQENNPAHSTPCTECSPPMLLPNSCSAAAHQRLHQGCPPHVCPECGGTAKQPLFQKHVHEACLHFSRRIGYRCSSCLVVFGGLNSVKSHIQQAHCDLFHKCPSCPMAFKSSPSIQSHITAQHPTLTDGQTMLIYKCVMCDTVFTHKPLLYAHFDSHLTNQKVHVFKCPECTKLFSQRSSLLDHFKTHKKSTLKEDLPSPPVASKRLAVKFESSDGEELMDREKEVKVKTERMKTPSKWKCLSCSTQYTEREHYISHMSEQHGKILKKFPCNKCESSFTTTSSLRRHIRDKHKVVNRGFRCQFCSESKKTFGSRSMLERHVQLRHSMNSSGQDTLTRGEEADSSSEQDSSLGSRRRRRAAVKMEQNEESTDRTSPVKKMRSTSSTPCSLPDSGFICAPCGFTTEEKANFLEHISQHRRGGTDGGSLQCLQCGACFTSTSSLSRHRFITHKLRESDSQQALGVHTSPSPGNVKNLDERSSLNGSAPASPSSQPSTGQGKEEEGALACKVCGKHFEKATDLNTHFRTHGMAFIIARNAGKTAKDGKCN